METRFMQTISLSLVVLTVLLSTGTAPAQTGDELVAQLTGKAEGPARDAAQLTEAYQKTIDYLRPLMSAENVGSRYSYQIALQDLGSYASRPGAEAQRLALATVMVKTLEQVKMENTVRNWFILQLQRIGKAESVPLLTKLMSDPDKHTRDYARRALEKNPDAGATEALLKELAGAKEARWRIGLINALGDRRAQTAVKPLTQALGDSDPSVAKAAAGALSRIGGPESAEALFAVLAKPAGPVSTKAAQGLIDMAEEMAAAQDMAGAAKMYGSVYEWASKATAAPGSMVPISIRVAASVGLIVTDPDRGTKEIVTLIQDDNPKMRGAAVQAARQSTSEAPARALTKLLPTLKSDSRVQVLGLIGDRKDASSENAVIQALADKDEAVSLAAAEALSRLGTEGSAKALFESAVNGRGNVKKASQDGLASMAGPQADALVKARAASGDPKARAVAINLLGQRRSEGATKLLAAYASDAEESVSAAAFQAMVNVADAVDPAALADLVAQTRSSGPRAAGVTALKAVLAKAPDREAAAQIVIARMNKAEGQTKLALLTSLSSAGGAAALKAVTEAARASDEALRDAGIRTLSEWPDYEATPILVDIASNGQTDLTHCVLATRGALRLIAANWTAPLDSRVTLCLKLLDVARRDDEKRLAIAALGTIPSARAANRLLQLAKDQNFKAEAGLAAVTLAGTVLMIDPQAAQDLAQKVLDLNISPDINERANAVIGGRGMRGMRRMRGGQRTR
jgi:HEAT repeat protein